MILDFSTNGIGSAALKALKVLGWVALSSAVTGLALYLQNYNIDDGQIVVVGIVGVVNAGIVFLQKWLTTVDPTKIVKPVVEV